MKQLKLGQGISLPVDVAGEAIAILAKRGAGKTNTATVLVEEMVGAGVQVVVLDPVGAWWGIRSSADGKSAGLAVPIIGGAHGDTPLEPTAGALIADVAVDTGQSLLVDLSDFPSKEAHRRFVTDFAERLFRRKAREKSLLHLVLEEADQFAPQQGRADTARMRGAIEQIVRLGRSRGLGVTMITQRSASLNKDILTQADVLIAMRTGGPHDRQALRAWVDSRGDEHADEVMDSLPGLATGEAWFWNPERALLKQAKVRRRHTFDSSATPKVGERRVEPKTSAAIDLTQLGEQILATAERAKATDPRELQKRIQDLERDVEHERRVRAVAEQQASTIAEPEKIVETVEVPVLADGQLEFLRAIARELQEAASRASETADEILASVARTDAQPRPAPVRPTTGAPTRAPQMPARALHAPTRAPAAAGGGDDDPQLKAGARRILETLARHHPMRVTRAQLGTLAKFKITGGTFQTYFSQLKRFDLIEEHAGEISITDYGLSYVGHVPAAPQTTEELLDMWRGALKAGARQMLDVLVENYPAEFDREQLADLVEMTASGGTFQTYLSTLRRNGLIDVDANGIRASDTLFIGARA